MASSFRIALIQFDIIWEDRDANILQLQEMMQFEEDIDLVILPEMWSTGFTMRPEIMAENTPGPALSWMLEYSHKINATIAGSISVHDRGKYYNRLYIVHPNSTIQQYDKKHLFSYGKEDQHYHPGLERIVVEINGWKIMPVVCYDLRFPVWCRNNIDYDMMIVVANWPVPRVHHWDALLKSRAIENQCYIAGVNRIGKDGNGLQYPGHSCVIDMNGDALLQMNNTAGAGIIALDQSKLIEYRDHFRFLQDQDVFQI